MSHPVTAYIIPAVIILTLTLTALWLIPRHETRAQQARQARRERRATDLEAIADATREHRVTSADWQAWEAEQHQWRSDEVRRAILDAFDQRQQEQP